MGRGSQKGKGEPEREGDPEWEGEPEWKKVARVRAGGGRQNRRDSRRE